MKLLPKKLWKRILLLLVLALLGPYLYSRATSYWNQVSVLELDLMEEIANDNSTGHFRCLCYKIAHGRGLAKSNFGGGNRDKHEQRLKEIAELLRKNSADIVILNEVDFNSVWSHSIDQAKFIAKHAGYRYVAQQRNLDFRVLFWKLDFGNAILSRFPIENPEVIDLPDYSLWETVAAGKKRALKATITVNKQPVEVIACHLSHRSEDLRVRSAEIINKATDKTPAPSLVGGDLNSTLPGLPQCNTDSQGRNAIKTFLKSGYFETRQQKINSENDFTFSSDKPRSVIDWVFVSKPMYLLDVTVLDSKLSDHRPIVADIHMD